MIGDIATMVAIATVLVMVVYVTTLYIIGLLNNAPLITMDLSWNRACAAFLTVRIIIAVGSVFVIAMVQHVNVMTQNIDYLQSDVQHIIMICQ
jgi:hypothetical protein